VQGITHPTGKEPVLDRTTIAKLDDRILVELTVGWKGGVLGTRYKTTVAWEIAKANHVAAKVLTDSAPMAASAREKELLDEYFKVRVYPAFYSGVSGNP